MTGDETFTIEDDLLVRRVVPRPGRGEPYQHTCTKKEFDDVAYAIEHMGASTFTDEDIRIEIDAPSTQVTVGKQRTVPRCPCSPRWVVSRWSALGASGSPLGQGLRLRAT